MTQTVLPSPVVSRAARIAFWVLVVATVFWTVVHLAGIFFIADGDDERLMFTSYAALNILSLVVLLGPFRGGQQLWAWAASWIQVVVTAATLPIIGLDPGLQYAGFSVVMAVCLLVARPASRS